MAKRFRLNRKATHTDEWVGLDVTAVRDVHPFRRWLQDLWTTVSSPPAIIAFLTAVLVKGCGHW
jgi:hypothetical protein